MESRTVDGRPSAWRQAGTLAILALISIAFTIDALIVNVALPKIEDQLGASVSQLAWTLDAFTLALAAWLLFAGKLGDRFGRKAVLITGLAIFGGASVFAAKATSPDLLIAARYLMGAGAGLVFPNSTGIVMEVFQKARPRSAAIAVLGATQGLGLAAGPVAGGLLLRRFWWGSIFIVNIPIVILLVIAAAIVIPRATRRTRDGKLDLIGSALATASVTSMVWGLIQAPTWGWQNAWIDGAFVGSLVVAGAWLWWEHRTNHPMVDLRWLGKPGFSAAAFALAAAYGAVVGGLLLLPQWLQTIDGNTPFSAGLRTAPVALALLLIAPIAVYISGRIGPRWVIACGLVLVAAGLALFARTDVHTPYWYVLASLLVAGAGIGAVAAPATNSVVDSITAELASAGAALSQTIQWIGASIGVAGVASVLDAVYHRELRPALIGLQPQVVNDANSSVAGAAKVAAKAGANGDALQTAAFHAFSLASRDAALAVAGAAALGALVVAIFMRRARRQPTVWDTLPNRIPVAEFVLEVLRTMGPTLTGTALLAGPFADLRRFLREQPSGTSEWVLAQLGCDENLENLGPEQLILAIGLAVIVRGRVAREGDEVCVSGEDTYRVGSDATLRVQSTERREPSPAAAAAAWWGAPRLDELDAVTARAAQMVAALGPQQDDPQPRCEPVLDAGIGVQELVALMSAGTPPQAWLPQGRTAAQQATIQVLGGRVTGTFGSWLGVDAIDANGTHRDFVVLPDGRVPNPAWLHSVQPARSA